MLKHIVFDWSGTLSDDIHSLYRVVGGMFRKHGWELMDFERFKDEFTLPYMDFWKHYTDLPEKDILAEFDAECRTHWRPSPLPHSAEALSGLSKKGVTMAILSSLLDHRLQEEVKGFGFRPYFLEVVGGAHDKREYLPLIISRNGFDPKRTAYVGDMTHDIETGKHAGVVTVAVLSGYQKKELLLRHHPDHIFQDVRGLLTLS